MRLSLIFELLLIFILLAFAASAVIDSKTTSRKYVKNTHNRNSIKKQANKQDSVNKYCSCSAKLCNCCREFNLPVVSLQGPGCASLQYLKGDRLAISMSFGERILTNTTISSRKPKPVCMPLPGGVSKFCGRVYNIGRQGQDFNACLGLELRALQDIEASLRVACFRFGSEGLRVEPSQPLPAVDDDDDADDDDDDDDDDEDDEFDFDGEEEEEEDDEDNDVDSADYSTFSVFGDDIIDSLFPGDTEVTETKPVKKTTTRKPPVRKITRKPIRATTIQRQPSYRKKVTTAKPALTTKINTATVTKRPASANVIMHSDKKPDMPDISVNNVPDTQAIDEDIPSSHQSIVAVTAMLQEYPGGMMPQVASAAVKPTEIVPVPPPVRIVSSLIETSASNSDYSINMTDSTIAQETTDQEKLTTYATPTENPTTTETDEEEDDDDPITDAVEDVFGENDGKDTSNTTIKSTTESNDIFDEIVDGVVDTIAGSDEVTDNKNGTASAVDSDEDDDDDDDEDDDDDSDDDLIDDDDDDEDEKERNFGKKQRRNKGRQSRVMWLDRLHW